jgi:xanthosine utilization system XapX-like protein
MAGEQIVPIAKLYIAGHPVNVGSVKSECGQHVFGEWPSRATAGNVIESGHNVEARGLT